MKTRRDFIKLSGIGLAGTAAINLESTAQTVNFSRESKEIPFELGIASYTFRKFSLEDTLAMTQRLAIKNIVFKSFHLPLESTKEEISQVVEKVKQAGLNLYGGGVIYMKNESEVNNAFEYASAAGMKMIISSPNHELLELVEKKVKEYNIYIAIHNHGPGDELYPTLESIYTKISSLDNRVGICHDIGHTTRYGEDPVRDTKRFFDRILDIHMKDVSSPTGEGDTIEIGRGVIDIAGVLSVLLKNNFSGKVSFEYEKDEDDPLPGLAESVGYVRGVLKML